MKKLSVYFLVMILLVTNLACGLSGGDDKDKENDQPAAGQQDEPSAGSDAEDNAGIFGKDLPALGEEQLISEGGYSFKTIPDFQMELDEGMVMLLDPEGDLDMGPMVIMSGAASEEKTVQELMDEMQGDMGFTFSKPEKVRIGGKDGLIADLSGEQDGVSMLGYTVAVMAAPTHEFMLLAGAGDDDWEEFAPYVEALINSITFHELSEAAVSSNQSSELSSGMYAYVNRNDVRDLLVDGGTLYAASLGGMVAWDLASGAMQGYTTLDGMGHVSSVSLALCDIPDERLIVGTLTGLSFFDPAGGVWERRELAPQDSYVSTNKIDRLFCDAENGRLVLGYSGLGVLDIASGDFARYNTSDETLLWNGVADVAVDGEDIWVASGYNGITLIQGDEITFFNEENGLPDGSVHALALAPDGTLWAGASDGLMHYQGNQWTLYGSESPARLTSVAELEISDEGEIWAATAPFGSGRLCLFDPDSEECVVETTAADGLPIYALALTDDGTPVYSTSEGIYLFDGSSVQEFICEDDRLASNFVDSFAPSADGRLWIGTDDGIHLIDPASPDSAWQTFRANETDGMNGDWASGIAGGNDGSTWFAIINASVSRLKDGEWTSYEDIYSYSSVAVDSQDNAWFGDDGDGIIVLDADGNQLMELTAENSALPSDNVRTLLSQGDTMWIGTGEGLAKYENGSLQVVFGVEDEDMLRSYFIRDLDLDEGGDLIIGTSESILRYNGGQVEMLYDLGELGIYDSLTEMELTQDGSAYVGSYYGLYYLDSAGGFTKMTTDDGLLTNGISALYVDQFDTIWVGGGGSNFDGGGIIHLVP